jgi:hypothetical protein
LEFCKWNGERKDTTIEEILIIPIKIHTLSSFCRNRRKRNLNLIMHIRRWQGGLDGSVFARFWRSEFELNIN